MTLKDVMIEDIDLGITKTNELIKQINLAEKLKDKDKLVDILNNNVLFTFSRLRLLIIADNAENPNFIKHYRDVCIVYGQVYDRVNKELKDIKERTAKFKPIRELGAIANKKKADEKHALILKMDKDLLKNIQTARWSLDKRAEYICNQKIKQLNGKPYSERTIKNIITGQSSDMT